MHIKAYDKISLENIKDKSLLNRIDSKYIIDEKNIDSILESFAVNDYSIVSINNKENLKYNTDYYDNVFNEIYKDHKRKKYPKIKIRIRTYENNQKYTEFKYKLEKDGVTIKNREKCSKYHNEDFLENSLNLRKTLNTSYNRITLVHKYRNERITIDSNIRFYNYLTSKEIIFNKYIIEVKQEKDNVIELLPKKYKTNFSKYCYGMDMTL